MSDGQERETRKDQARKVTIIRPSEWQGDPELLGTPELAMLFMETFPALLRSGFEPPIYFTMLMSTGFFRFGRFFLDGTEPVAEIEASYTPAAGRKWDLHCLFVDSRGRCARLGAGLEHRRLTTWIDDVESSFSLLPTRWVD